MFLVVNLVLVIVTMISILLILVWDFVVASMVCILTDNTETNTWSEVQPSGDAPEPRSGHSAVIHHGSMYIFGGRNQDPRYFSDIYQFEFGLYSN